MVAKHSQLCSICNLVAEWNSGKGGGLATWIMEGLPVLEEFTGIAIEGPGWVPDLGVKSDTKNKKL